MTAANLAEAMAARLCHDIAGPAGTIASLLDMAAEDPGQSAEAMALAREAAAQMLRRIRVTRAAWGGPDAWPETELPALLAQIASPGLRIALATATGAFRRTIGADRLLLNVALLGAEALRGQGDLHFDATPEGISATLTATGPGARAMWPPLDAPRIEARLFQPAWTVQVARACAFHIRSEGATLRIMPPA